MTTREHQKSKETGGEAAPKENGGGFGGGGRHALVGEDGWLIRRRAFVAEGCRRDTERSLLLRACARLVQREILPALAQLVLSYSVYAQDVHLARARSEEFG
jgi:hypothetical protein